jgi:hypothetical protein
VNLPKYFESYAPTIRKAIECGLPFPKIERAEAASAAGRLLGSFPSGQPQDPRGYVAAVVAVLAEYPAEIVERVTDPRTGIARSCTFLPAIKELTDALEAEMRVARQKWGEARRHEQRCIEGEKLIVDNEAKERVGVGFRQLSSRIQAAPDPVPPRQLVPKLRPISGHANRVLADLQRRKRAKEATE